MARPFVKGPSLADIVRDRKKGCCAFCGTPFYGPAKYQPTTIVCRSKPCLRQYQKMYSRQKRRNLRDAKAFAVPTTPYEDRGDGSSCEVIWSKHRWASWRAGNPPTRMCLRCHRIQKKET